VRQPGAGLGLSLVKSLIELHGGSVAIESASGCGTRITCRLPVSQQTTTDAAAIDARLLVHPAAHAENAATEELRVPIQA
jgi:chemotaxis protein histidine kinase CheA